MNQCSSAAVESFLNQYGWKYTQSAKGVFQTGWSSDFRSYPLRILIDEAFLTLQVQPFFRTDVDLSAFPDVTTYLLEMNYHSLMVKVSIDEVGDLVLSVSILIQTLDFDNFSSALGILAHYSDQVFDEINHLLNAENNTPH